MFKRLTRGYPILLLVIAVLSARDSDAARRPQFKIPPKGVVKVYQPTCPELLSGVSPEISISKWLNETTTLSGISNGVHPELRAEIMETLLANIMELYNRLPSSKGTELLGLLDSFRVTVTPMEMRERPPGPLEESRPVSAVPPRMADTMAFDVRRNVLLVSPRYLSAEAPFGFTSLGAFLMLHEADHIEYFKNRKLLPLEMRLAEKSSIARRVLKWTTGGMLQETEERAYRRLYQAMRPFVTDDATLSEFIEIILEDSGLPVEESKNILDIMNNSRLDRKGKLRAALSPQFQPLKLQAEELKKAFARYFIFPFQIRNLSEDEFVTLRLRSATYQGSFF